MRSTLNIMLEWLRKIHHPSPGALVSSLDGELSSTQNATVMAHVSKCSRCRARLEQLQEGLQFFNRAIEESAPPFSLEDGLQQFAVQLEQRKLTSTPSQPIHLPKQADALYDRLLAELSIYIGRRTALRLLDACNHQRLQRESFSRTVEPVVTAFLGQHAGAAVLANVLRIWDRTQQVPS